MWGSVSPWRLWTGDLRWFILEGDHPGDSGHVTLGTGCESGSPLRLWAFDPVTGSWRGNYPG